MGKQILLAGALLDVLADAFGVKPLLEKVSVGRQLREWRAGQQKEPATQRAIIEAIAVAVLTVPDHECALAGPLEDEELAGVACRVLFRWARWVDALVLAEGDPELKSDWLVEHTLTLWAMSLAIVRLAWGVELPPEPRIAQWLPTGFDDEKRSLPAEYLDAMLRAAQGNGTQKELLDRLAAARPSDDGAAVKSSTLKRWRTGESVPNGTRPAEVAEVVGDHALRVKLGIRQIVDKLACFGADRVRNRNATLLWMLNAEVKALQVQQGLMEHGFDGARCLRALASDDVLCGLLPPLTPVSTSADLPLGMRGQAGLLVEVKQGEQRGVAFIRVPPDQPLRIHLSFKEPSSG